MINFKRESERVPSTLIVLSLSILVGALLFMLLVPKPSVAGIAKGRVLSRRKVEKEIADTKVRIAESTKAIRPRLWKEDTETMTSLILNQVTQLSNQNHLNMAAFRPQRVQPLEGTVELPFNVHLSGSYPEVRNLISALDNPKSKIIVRSVQIASSDASTSTITAVLGISAYQEVKAQTAVAEKSQPGETNAKN